MEQSAMRRISRVLSPRGFLSGKEIFKHLGALTASQKKTLLELQKCQEIVPHSLFRLGELLVATGQITRDQLKTALCRQSLSHHKLGEVLIEEGYVSPTRVNYAIGLQKVLRRAVLGVALTLATSTLSHASTRSDATTLITMKKVQDESGEFACLSAREAELVRLVNEYRESNGLPPIVNSRSLNKVARIHAIDLRNNIPAEGKDSRGLDCSLHSWSDKGSWQSVCYTKDDRYAEAMWNKPREITDSTYSGDGFENAYYTSETEASPQKVLDAWKLSPSHNAILLESGIWKGSNLLAFGVGINKNFAVIWVGSLTDPLGPMKVCSTAIE